MIRALLAVAALALVVPTLAAAKEPGTASISGPGFSKTLKWRGGDFATTPLARLTEQSGFFPSAVGQQPDPMLHERPKGNLGPRYTITWDVPGPPGNRKHRVHQDLYPYAAGGAVTYMKPGQPIFEMKTVGGWWRDTLLKDTLVRMGMPARAPRRSSGTNYALLAGIGIPGALALGGAGWLVRRRRA